MFGWAFAVQVLVAGIATARGWGFLPWIILASVFLTGVVAGPFVTHRNVDSWVMFMLLLDLGATLSCAIMGYVGRSPRAEPTY